MRFFAAEFIREAAFELLHEELPYSVAVEIDEFREGADPVYIRAVVYVERASQKGIVIGDGGRTIKALGQTARAKVEALLGTRVFLDLHVKVLPKWRRRDASLKRLGYVPCASPPICWKYWCVPSARDRSSTAPRRPPKPWCPTPAASSTPSKTTFPSC